MSKENEMAEAETQVVEEENVEVTLDDEPKKVVSETDVSDSGWLFSFIVAGTNY